MGSPSNLAGPVSTIALGEASGMSPLLSPGTPAEKGTKLE